MVGKFLFLLLLCVLHYYPAKGQVGVARFNARGVNGYISFTVQSDGVQIQANLQGLVGNQGWHVHTLPVDQTANPSVQCLSNIVGPHYDPFNRNNDSDYQTRCMADRSMCEAGDLAGKFGPLTATNQPLTLLDNTGTLFLRGQHSIIGRSIVIHRHGSNKNFECGTIRSQNEINGTPVSLLQATFINPIAGTIYFRQVQGEEVQMWGKFYWIDDTATTVDHNWHIHELAPGEEYRLGVCDINSTVGNIRGHFRPFGNGPPSINNYALICNPTVTSGCEVGDLTGKHARINVAATPSPYVNESFFFTDNFLNLTGVPEYSVLNRSVAIHARNRGGPVVACAPLVVSENITLKQFGINQVTISQGSPFEDTVITTTGSRTTTTIHGSAPNQLSLTCSSDNVFSPYEPVINPDSNVITPDRYSLGELQRRYFDIRAATSQRVFDMPVYGADVSIASLTLRTEVENGGETNCNTLFPVVDSSVIVAKASFSRVVRGAAYFVQRDNGFDQLGNTLIILDLYYEGQQSATSGHNWHIHVNPSPSSEVTCSPTVGGHYNPFNVSLSVDGGNSNYGTDCSPRYQLRCESGDLVGKHGSLNISPNGPNRPTYTYIDSNLHLTGNSTIIGRSIALHDIITNLPIFDCGTISRYYISSRDVMVTAKAGNILRTRLTEMLSQMISVDPTDILVLGLQNTTLFGFQCVNVKVQVLGPTQNMADSLAVQLQSQRLDLGELTCSAVITQASLFLPLMMVLLYLFNF